MLLGWQTPQLRDRPIVSTISVLPLVQVNKTPGGWLVGLVLAPSTLQMVTSSLSIAGQPAASVQGTSLSITTYPCWPSSVKFDQSCGIALPNFAQTPLPPSFKAS